VLGTYLLLVYTVVIFALGLGIGVYLYPLDVPVYLKWGFAYLASQVLAGIVLILIATIRRYGHVSANEIQGWKDLHR